MALDNGGMEREELIAMVRYAPVEAPLEHWESLVAGKWRERNIVIEAEYRLRLHPPPQASRALDAHLKVGKTRYRFD